MIRNHAATDDILVHARTADFLAHLVDDEQMVLEVGKAILQRLGHEVVTAESGEEALEKFDRHQETIGCVVLDLTMPQIDGAEVFRQLRAERRDLPVVLTSGYSEQHVQQLVGDERPDGFVQKPYLPTELMEVVRRALP